MLVSKSHFKNLIVFFTLLSCGNMRLLEEKKIESKRLSTEPTLSMLDNKTKDGGRSDKVSVFQIDDVAFEISSLSISLREYLTTEVPYVVFKLPVNADYAEIIRCKDDVLLTTGSVTLNWRDIEFDSTTEADRSAIYSRSNLLNAAKSSTHSCVVISSGTKDEAFQDPWPPDGNYRYLVTACVNPKRLIVPTGMLRRNCSKRVVVSTLLKDYVNKRAREHAKYKNQKAVHENQMDQLALAIRNKCNFWIEQEKACELEDTERIKNKVRKDAIALLAAATVETILEIKTMTADPLFSFGGAMNILGFVSALAGFSFAETFKKLATAPGDYSRGCPEAHATDLKIQGLIKDMVIESKKLNDATKMADKLREGQKVLAGADDMTLEQGSIADSNATTTEDSTGTDSSISDEI